MRGACRHGLSRRSASKCALWRGHRSWTFHREVRLFETPGRRHAQANCGNPCRFAVLFFGGCGRACPARALRIWPSREETGSTTVRARDPARAEPHRVARLAYADGCSAAASGEQELDGATSRLVRSHCRRRGWSSLGRRFVQRWLLPHRCRRCGDGRIVVRSWRGCVDRVGGRAGEVGVSLRLDVAKPQVNHHRLNRSFSNMCWVSVRRFGEN